MTRIETVSLSEIGMNKISVNTHVAAISENRDTVFTQLIDLDDNGVAEQLVLLASIPSNTSLKYHFIKIGTPIAFKSSKSTFCRFVPERVDDFAWENDKVAFRTYGQACQKLFEAGDKSGLISSGIDCWLKKVDYPIINRWYNKMQTGESYHNDNGEGYDPYHVGISRGCGGTAIRYKGKFYYSKNFSNYKVMANGPLRSVFKLKYDPILIDGNPVEEIKTITIDLGNNYYRCDVEFKSKLKIDTLAIGLTLHTGKGQVFSSENGWISYWENIDDSQLGVGAWVPKKKVLAVEKLNFGQDANHIWLYSSIQNNKSNYFSGFGWTKSLQFENCHDWNNYIALEQVCISDFK